MANYEVIDDDFQEEATVVPLVRPGMGKSRAKLARRCPACNQFWTNSGSHRIVSLKCSHTFGERCVKEGLKGKAARGQCCICGDSYRKADIRPIWPSKVFQEDSAIVNTLTDKLRTLTEQNISKEKDLIQARHDYEALKEKLKQITDPLVEKNTALVGHEASQERLRQYRCCANHVFAEERNVVRVMTAMPAHDMVVVSKKLGLEDFGLVKCRPYDAGVQETIRCHTKLIRDVRTSERIADNGAGTVLSTGLDKTLQLISTANNCVLIRYPLPSQGWSCEFDQADPSILYCGLADSTIQVYDIRNTRHSVDELKSPLVKSMPMHSLISCPAKSPMTKSLYCANMQHTYRWDWGMDEPKVPTALSVQQEGYQPFSLAYDTEQDLLMVSGRHKGKTLYSIATRGDVPGAEVIRGEYESAHFQQTMVRADIQGGTACIVDKNSMVRVWRDNEVQHTLELDRKLDVLDLKFSRMQDRRLLLALMDNRLQVFEAPDDQ
ncbi:hypothetical protein BC940DRAFT_51819 [Gongronella butleri]|nr:hypothetical protein BC940DRAFT_51819 [Gongronella butleri]